MRKIFYIVQLLGVLFLSCTGSEHPNQIIYEKNKAEIYSVPSNDLEMDSAIAKAKMTFRQFYLLLNANDTTKKNLSIKLAFDVNKETNGEVSLEHIWISHLDIVHDSLFGLVSNEPQWTKAVKLWQKILLTQVKLLIGTILRMAD